LEVELTTGKIGVRFSQEDRYWVIEDGTLWMETRDSWFGNYLDYHDTERLCTKLGANDPMPLNTRKSLKAAQVKIDKFMQEASKLFGKELTFIDNFQELYDKLKAAGRDQTWLFKIGECLERYPQQLVKAFTQFCKDNDNKEALEEVLTAGRIGVRFSGKDEYWVIEDGTLWMETRDSWFGNYLDNHDSAKLEKKL